MILPLERQEFFEGNRGTCCGALLEPAHVSVPLAQSPKTSSGVLPAIAALGAPVFRAQQRDSSPQTENLHLATHQ
jgi:hypothetical protein